MIEHHSQPRRRTDPAAGSEPNLISAQPTQDAASALVAHLYAQHFHEVPGIELAHYYQSASAARIGGDLVDVYHYDNGATSFLIADIAGKGPDAATHAALVKYGVRAYTSAGLTAEQVLCDLNRLYRETDAFERTESFVSLFFGIVDATRSALNYASAGHEPVALRHPGEPPQLLPPTGPIVGVFEDYHKLISQRFVPVHAGTLLVAVTDGVTEARPPSGTAFFGTARLLQQVACDAERPVGEQVRRLFEATDRFCEGVHRDDVAILAARIAPEARATASNARP